MPPLSTIRNWAHDALAILGFLGFLYGLVTQAISSADPSFTAAHSMTLLWVGGLFTIASKFIDSANNGLSMLAGIWPNANSAAATKAVTPAVVNPPA